MMMPKEQECKNFGLCDSGEELSITPDEGIRQECRNVGSMNRNFFGCIH